MTQRVCLLVGAGASYGAFDADDLRPPLGDSLFTELVAKFPHTWGALTDSVVEIFSSRDHGFERGMGELWAHDDGRVQPLLLDLAMYFAPMRPPTFGVNRYANLAARLHDRGLLV